jgi:SAM-dependent methyltransferase
MQLDEVCETVVSVRWVLVVMSTLTPTAALLAYEQFAPVYDRFTASYDHLGWVTRLERVARSHGLRGHSALDVACGTGKSFAPLVELGYDIWACDLSPAMVERARSSGTLDADRIVVADMRELPQLGAFDLVTCLDDAVNYLLEPEDLLAAFASVERVLAPNGVYVFDTNSLATYRAAFAAHSTFERPEAGASWRGETTAPIGPGSLCSGSIEIAGAPDVSWHLQRHHPRSTIERALRSAGLACLAVLGQSTGGVLHEDADEDVHTKVVYVAGRAFHDIDAAGEEVTTPMTFIRPFIRP